MCRYKWFPVKGCDEEGSLRLSEATAMPASGMLRCIITKNEPVVRPMLELNVN